MEPEADTISHTEGRPLVERIGVYRVLGEGGFGFVFLAEPERLRAARKCGWGAACNPRCPRR